MSTQAELLAAAIAETRQLLEKLALRGQQTINLAPEVALAIDRLSAAPPPPAAVAAVASVPAEHSARPMEAPAVAPIPAVPSGPRDQALAELAAQVTHCARCGLQDTRTKTVFGVGNPNADIVFVGEAPGADEDRQGIPFVGRAGQLLNDIIEKGMQIKREDVYICNVLKCRPPGNRTPSPEEMLHCQPFLQQQLAIIKPKIIVALGRPAAQCLLQTDESVGRLRGKWHDYHGIPLRVTFHPAYLLRNPADKRLTWEDVKEILKKLRSEN